MTHQHQHRFTVAALRRVLRGAIITLNRKKGGAAISSSPAEVPRTVAVIGSARLSPPDPRCIPAEQIGAAIAAQGWTLMTGGYGGLMEVASRAAAQAARRHSNSYRGGSGLRGVLRGLWCTEHAPKPQSTPVMSIWLIRERRDKTTGASVTSGRRGCPEAIVALSAGVRCERAALTVARARARLTKQALGPRTWGSGA
jgi:SLOG cluster4 family